MSAAVLRAAEPVGLGGTDRPSARRPGTGDPRLFCLPYAGGSASLFHGWRRYAPRPLAIHPVELPGRGQRFREAPVTSFPALVDRLAGDLCAAARSPYALFGHSMGALLAFELVRVLRRSGCDLPAHLFVSGCRAPHLPNSDTRRSELTDAALIGELRRLNGTPPAVLDNAELMALVLPVLRADFAVCDSYRYRPDAPLPCPITAFGGDQDPRAPDTALQAWCLHTSAGFAAHRFPGGHFFLHGAEASMLATIAACLRSDLPPVA